MEWYNKLNSIRIYVKSCPFAKHSTFVQNQQVCQYFRCVQLFPMDCSPLGFCVHGILQARILEWVTISRGSSQRRD